LKAKTDILTKDLYRFYAHRVKETILEIENQIPCECEEEREKRNGVFLLCDSIINKSNNGKNKENKSSDREEIKPETEVVILERCKKTGDVHYKITKYISWVEKMK